MSVLKAITEKMKNLILIFVIIISGCNIQPFPYWNPNYRLDYGANAETCLLDSNNTILIKASILDYNFDSSFIILLQEPEEAILQGTDKYSTMTLSERKEVIEKSTLRQYWIINRINDSIFGPFDKKLYMDKRQYLGISKELELKTK